MFINIHFPKWEAANIWWFWLIKFPSRCKERRVNGFKLTCATLQPEVNRCFRGSTSVQDSLFSPLCTSVCVCVVFGSVSVCVSTYTSHVNAAGVSCSVQGHVTDTCGSCVQRRAANRSLSRHEPSSPLFLASLSLSLSLTFGPTSLDFPSSLPLPPFAGLGSIQHRPDWEPRHRLYPAEVTWTRPCFCHMRSLLFQLSESGLTSSTTTTTTPTSTAALAADNTSYLPAASKWSGGRVGVSVCGSASGDGPCWRLRAGSKGEAGCRRGGRACLAHSSVLFNERWPGDKLISSVKELNAELRWDWGRGSSLEPKVFLTCNSSK